MKLNHIYNMKKIKFLPLIALLFIASISKSNANISDFSFDDSKVEAIFESVADLEAVLIENSTADYETVQLYSPLALNKATQSNMLISSLNLATNMEDGPALGISGYFWGGCLGLLGILAVYLILDDSSKENRQDEVKKAAIGCGVVSVAYIAYWAILVRKAV
jgi:hypothetical protein